jgi:uncharacterized membrane-anchored protein
MQLSNPHEMTTSQLEAGDNELSHKFWQAMLAAGIPFLLFVAAWTGTLPVPIDPQKNPISNQVFDLIVVAGSFLTGISTLLLTFAIGKVQREIRIELGNRHHEH